MGDGINDTPLTSPSRYDDVNSTLKTTFALTISNLKSALKEGEAVWNQYLIAMSKGKKEIKMMNLDFNRWNEILVVQATQLITGLPQNIDYLWILNANFGTDFVDALIQRVLRSRYLDYSEKGFLSQA